jgi:hypothetical protein
MSPLNVEAEVHDIAFLDDVFLAFEPQLAGIAGTGLTLELAVVVVAVTSARMKPRSKSVWITRRLWRRGSVRTVQARTSFSPAVK